MGKLDGKVAVITGGTTGMALAGAKIGRDVTGIRGDAADLGDLDRLYDIVRREKGNIDVLWAGAGGGEPATAALFLASDDSSYVNGMEFVADGGTTAI